MSYPLNPAESHAASPGAKPMARRTRRVAATCETNEITAMPNHNERGYGTATLRLGVYGDDVRLLQTQLHALGYTLEADSDYGIATRDAVSAFQNDHGLSPNGIAGPATITTAISALRFMKEMPGMAVPERRVSVSPPARSPRVRARAIAALA